LDCGEDGIFIHTKNPNAENFPLKVQGENDIKCSNQNLSDFMKNTGLEILGLEHQEGYCFYLSDK